MAGVLPWSPAAASVTLVDLLPWSPAAASFTLVDLLAGGLVGAGALFFLAGTVGLLRFPDVYCRLHALTKADNLGLGFIALGLSLKAPDWAARLQLLLTWLLVLAAAATVAHLLARTSLRQGVVAARGGGPPSTPSPPSGASGASGAEAGSETA